MAAPQNDNAAAMARLIAFVNSRDIDAGTDEWDSPQSLVSWLAAHDLVAGRPIADEADLQTARTVREGLRQALLAHDRHAEPPDAEPLPVVSFPLQLRIDAGGHAVLTSASDGVDAALATLVAAIPAAQADGTWSRVKACPESTCQWAFLDQSRNRSRRWCSMEVCGNREKSRSFRDRQRAGD